MTTRALGFLAEQKARLYLEKQGLIWVLSNYQCKGGEIDLIMQENDDIIFVEVRYRSNQSFGESIESITRPKQLRIILAAWHFLLERQWVDQVNCRFDVLGLNAVYECNWIPNAFEVEYH